MTDDGQSQVQNAAMSDEIDDSLRALDVFMFHVVRATFLCGIRV
jgi:hypothetical protein